jgi:hypothetical protein
LGVILLSSALALLVGAFLIVALLTERLGLTVIAAFIVYAPAFALGMVFHGRHLAIPPTARNRSEAV